MDELFCKTCQKKTVHVGVKGKNIMRCHKCYTEQPRPQPDTTGWNEREKEVWKVIFQLEMNESPMSVRRILDNMPYANAFTEWDARKVLEITGKLGAEASNEEMNKLRQERYSLADATLLNQIKQKIHAITKELDETETKKFPVSLEQKSIKRALITLIAEMQFHNLLEKDFHVIEGNQVNEQ
jgi:hypothetical protein